MQRDCASRTAGCDRRPPVAGASRSCSRCSAGRDRRALRRPRRGSRRTPCRAPRSARRSAWTTGSRSCWVPFESSCGGSEGDVDVALGRVDAGADHFAGGARDLTGAHVADLPGAELSDARVADAHATAEGQRAAGLLAGDQDRLRAIALRLEVALAEADRAALALLGVALADDRLEALHVQPVAVAAALPVLAHRVEHLGGPAEERLAVLPVGAELLEVVRCQAPVLAGELKVQAIAV